ncbi:MAG TPA: tetraacyldisaccharide 4'-kinase [Desulfuromonadales bacterium]|nr:tetraacyldisaccharide 4'-kinase [Desulfuromonadales bacterium]
MADVAAFHRRVVCQGAQRFSESLLLQLLRPFGWLYGVLGVLRAVLYRTGIFSSYRAPVPVVSVGNLAAGGTGKTPLVDHLVREQLRLGHRVAVVSRGYGGRGVEGVGVVSDGTGPLLAPGVCGDESYLLARRNPEALVLVARRRAEGVRLAVERFGAELIILDDGFQHLAVRRDLDLVLLDARCPLGNGRPLPAGLLREFPTALNRGDLFLLTRCSTPDAPPLPVPGPLMTSRHRLASEAVVLDGGSLPLSELRARRGVAFAGIADPVAFFADLQQAGLDLAATVAFADHTGYDEVALARLDAVSAGADYLVTTEKDGVKLLGRKLPLPCYLVPLTLEIKESSALSAALAALTNKEASMTLPADLLALLACPQCKGEVALREDGQALTCGRCRLVFPIRDRIPVMLIDEAEKF